MKKPLSNRGRILLALLVFLLGFGIVSCGKKTSVDRGLVAVYSVFSEPVPIWDPSDTLSDEVIVLQNIYETLVRYNVQTDAFEPLLAESYEKSDDGRTWTFKLRDNVLFHTGGKLSAGMVKRSIERLLERGMGVVDLWDSLESIEVVDPLTVAFKLRFADDVERLAASAYGAYIFDVDAAEEKGDDWFNEGHDAGSGPYTVSRWVRDAELILEQFPDYWQGWQPHQFSTIVFKTTPEATTREMQLEAGEVDIVSGLLPEQLETIRKDPELVVENAPRFENLTLLLNTQKEPLNNPLVRKALACAIPYDAIIDKLLQGTARRSIGYIPSGLLGHDDTLPAYEFKPEEAKRLLAESGVDTSNLVLTLTFVAGDETERPVAEFLKTSFAALGLEVRLQAMPWDAQWDRAKAPNPQDRQDMLLMLYWPSYADPYNLLSMGYRSEKEINYNLSYYANSAFDALIDKARRLAGSNPGAARQLYREAQELLIRDVPGIALFDTQGAFGIRKDFKGHVPNPYYTGVVFFYDTWRELPDAP